MKSEWIDMAFGRNRGRAFTKMKWNDLEGNFDHKNPRATCTRTKWVKTDAKPAESGKDWGYQRKRSTDCWFDCAKDMDEDVK